LISFGARRKKGKSTKTVEKKAEWINFLTKNTMKLLIS
jgi:hypothetical protein